MTETSHQETKIVPALATLATPIGQLNLLPGNPRRGNVEAVAASLATFGQRKPIVANRDGTVIAGNHTLQAARSLGWSEIAVVFVEDDDTTAKAYALADNRTAELGSYDDNALAELITEVRDADEEMLAATGWTDDDLTDILDRIEPIVIDPVDDDVPETAPSITVPGDLWQLGKHRVKCGDSTILSDVQELMGGVKADMVWTDPPYGVEYVGKTADALTIANDGVAEYQIVLAGAFDNILKAANPGAAVYVAGPPGPPGIPFAIELMQRNLFRQRLVWVKDRSALGHSDCHYRSEDIYYGYVPGASGRRGRGGSGWYGDNAQSTVLEFDRPSRNAEHPTMKPIHLIAYCLGNSSRRGAAILDLFGGSGSTLMACEQTDRIGYLMELDPRYVDVICRRWQRHTGILPVNAATGQTHDFDPT